MILRVAKFLLYFLALAFGFVSPLDIRNGRCTAGLLRQQVPNTDIPQPQAGPY